MWKIQPGQKKELPVARFSLLAKNKNLPKFSGSCFLSKHPQKSPRSPL
jgi:hypothetical protein